MEGRNLMVLLSALLWSISSTLAGRPQPPPSVAAAVTLCIEPSPALEQFIEPLALPPLVDVSDGDRVVTMGAFRISQKLHRDLPNTTLYAYGESQEAAAFPVADQAQRGTPTKIKWENHIPDKRHFLEIDDAIHWAKPQHGGVPVVAHLHGGEVGSSSDGHPDAWFTPNFTDTGPSFLAPTYSYPNSQPPAALWYHDHTIGITRVNVMAGLSGFYIIRGSPQEDLFLPVGIPLFVKDWRFFANGSINFRVRGFAAGEAGWCPEYGDTMLVNGKVWPYLRVFPGVYRFRLLNGCNARFLDLSLQIISGSNATSIVNGSLGFLQIGTDGGFLPEAKTRASLLISPGERVDVLVDFGGLENGTEVLLSNSAPSPFPYADSAYFSLGTADVMKFVVVDYGGATEGLLNADYELPPSLTTAAVAATQAKSIMTTRTFNLTRHSAIDGKPPANRIGDGRWEDPVDQISVAGASEVWEIINVSEDAHNMQIHLVQFQMLSQQSYDMEAYENGSCSVQVPYPDAGTCFIEEARGPEAYQEGWKDTVIAWPANVTRILVTFASRDGSPFPFDPTSGPGYLWNSATPDHEDYEMLKRFFITSISLLESTTS